MLLPDRVELRRQPGGRFHDLDAVRRHGFDVTLVFGFAGLPAARLRLLRRAEHGFLLAGAKLAERRLADDDHVLRQERLRVVVVLQIIPRLAVHSGGARCDHRVDQPGSERLRNVRHLHGRRHRADQFGKARRRRTVRAELGALQIAEGIDFLLGIDALRRPGHGVEQLDALSVETFLDVGLRGLPEVALLRVAVGQKWN